MDSSKHLLFKGCKCLGWGPHMGSGGDNAEIAGGPISPQDKIWSLFLLWGTFYGLKFLKDIRLFKNNKIW